jgi:hypothetical protein
VVLLGVGPRTTQTRRTPHLWTLPISTIRHRDSVTCRELTTKRLKPFGGDHRMGCYVDDSAFLTAMQGSGGEGSTGSDHHSASKDHPVTLASGERLVLGVSTQEVGALERWKLDDNPTCWST